MWVGNFAEEIKLSQSSEALGAFIENVVGDFNDIRTRETLGVDLNPSISKVETRGESIMV